MKGGEKMQETNQMRDQLINEFTENYMEKLFYFCLKKTGSNVEAEDLTQDISLQIITALNKGTIPTSFSAWVWRIARNRYSVWAKEKHSRNESVTGSDIGDYEVEDESENILDEMIHTEQMALLRRELAFIKSDYRNIVVAYYIENKSVRDIASSLSLSISAVQQRLHRARIILKEGMDMAREFGKRSYSPENITFASSGSQPSGLPWRVVQRRIPNNILLQASNNPSTLEELSIELGIALPYMEEEVDEHDYAGEVHREDREVIRALPPAKPLRHLALPVPRSHARSPLVVQRLSHTRFSRPGGKKAGPPSGDPALRHGGEKNYSSTVSSASAASGSASTASACSLSGSGLTSTSVPRVSAAAFMEREMRRRSRSISMTFTWTVSPTVQT